MHAATAGRVCWRRRQGRGGGRAGPGRQRRGLQPAPRWSSGLGGGVLRHLAAARRGGQRRSPRQRGCAAAVSHRRGVAHGAGPALCLPGADAYQHPRRPAGPAAAMQAPDRRLAAGRAAGFGRWADLAGRRHPADAAGDGALDRHPVRPDRRLRRHHPAALRRRRAAGQSTRGARLRRRRRGTVRRADDAGRPRQPGGEFRTRRASVSGGAGDPAEGAGDQ